MTELDPTICRRARLARDHRFDGEFFLAVKTTGIYCRPVCPARPPRESNVSYFRSAAEAAHAGYRPCLRCRPESAPMSPAWMGTDTTLKRALDLIHEGYLNDHTVGRLAARLGVGERYLRKLFQQKLGVAPTTVAQTQRLHFAQKLLLETELSITQVAFASGFGSLRRFNSATRSAFGCAPGELRRRRVGSGGEGITLSLTYRPPYDWEGVLGLFARHAVAGIESVNANTYQRQLRTVHGAAVIAVKTARTRDRHCLELQLRLTDNRDLMPLVAQVRRMFDLDAQPTDIASCLTADPLLLPLLDRYPGIRSPTVASPFESSVRAILGQQVSTQAARRMCAEIVAAADERHDIGGESLQLFPSPRGLAELPDTVLRMPGSRRNTLRAVCEFFDGADAADSDAVLTGLAQIKGIGPWTVALVSMRGYGRPDHFPDSDLGLVKAAESLSGSPAPLRTRSYNWQPWRSYAANLLWRSLNHG